MTLPALAGAFVSIAMATAAFAQDRAIVVGSRCGERYDFSGEMAKQIRGLRSHGWQVATLFTSARDEERKVVAAASGQPAKALKEFDKAAFYTLLDEAIRDVPAGAQLFISFNTHGLPADADKAHRICGEDGPYPDYYPVDDPELVSRLQKLKTKGVRMAFSDMSCYGGGSIKPLSPFGCVVTSQAGNRVANPDGVNGVIGVLLNLTPEQLRGKGLVQDGRLTLEDVFIEALVNASRYDTDSKSMNQPQISGFEPLERSSEDFLSLLADRRQYGNQLPRLEKPEACKLQDAAQDSLKVFFGNLSAELERNERFSRFHSTLERITGQRERPPLQLLSDLSNAVKAADIINGVYNTLAEEESEIRENLKDVPWGRQMLISVPLSGGIGHYSEQLKDSFWINISDNPQFKDGQISSTVYAYDLVDPAISARRIAKKIIERTKGAVGIAAYARTLEVRLHRAFLEARKQAPVAFWNGFEPKVRPLKEIWAKMDDLRSRHPELEQFENSPLTRQINRARFYAYMAAREKRIAAPKPSESLTDCENFTLAKVKQR